MAHQLPMGPDIRLRPGVQRLRPQEIQAVHDKYLLGLELMNLKRIDKMVDLIVFVKLVKMD